MKALLLAVCFVVAVLAKPASITPEMYPKGHVTADDHTHAGATFKPIIVPKGDPRANEFAVLPVQAVTPFVDNVPLVDNVLPPTPMPDAAPVVAPAPAAPLVDSVIPPTPEPTPSLALPATPAPAAPVAAPLVDDVIPPTPEPEQPAKPIVLKKAGAPKKPAPKPAAGGACGSYTGKPLQTVTGNGGKKYQAYLIQKKHLVNEASYGVPAVQSDNRIVQSTGLACAFEKMREAAAKANVWIKIASGFRTLSRQQYFYNCMQTRACNGGNLAAVPGTSNHGAGLALDLNTNCSGQGYAAHPPADCKNSKVYMWLAKHARTYGFVRAVQKEPWHWEHHPGRAPPSWQSW